ncbi:MAG: hypothetical protein LBQ31_06895 [Bacteroidales bacterium]|nr:hypothetical protein [Bacteroidales bacterium]
MPCKQRFFVLRRNAEKAVVRWVALGIAAEILFADVLFADGGGFYLC